MRYKLDQSGEAAVLTLNGDVIEGIDAALAPVGRALKSRKLTIDCAGVGRINSIGIGQWTLFLGMLPKGTALSFSHCPVSFIGYVNLLPKILGGGAVTSFFAPYRCKPCNVSQDLELLAANCHTERRFPPSACPKCQMPMAPIGNEEEYLAFLDV